MDSKILLQKILQRFSELKTSKVEGYNSFGYIRETENAVYVSRENGKDTRIPFDKLIIGIDVYKEYPNLYLEGPKALRQFEIKYITSPIWSLLHLLTKESYTVK